MQQLPALLRQGYHTSLKALQGPAGLQVVMLLLLLDRREVQEQAALAAIRSSSSSTPADMPLIAMDRRRSQSISRGGSCSRSVQRALQQVLPWLMMPACSLRCRLPVAALTAAAGDG
jgi:hypothetical protein